MHEIQLVNFYFGSIIIVVKQCNSVSVVTYFDEVPVYWTSLKPDSFLGTLVASIVLRVASNSHIIRNKRIDDRDCKNNQNQTAYIPETFDSGVHPWYFQGHKEPQMLSPIIHCCGMSFSEKNNIYFSTEFLFNKERYDQTFFIRIG